MSVLIDDIIAVEFPGVPYANPLKYWQSWEYEKCPHYTTQRNKKQWSLYIMSPSSALTHHQLKIQDVPPLLLYRGVLV